MPLEHLAQTDPEVAQIINAELDRQRHCIELIASENVVSVPVLEAVGSVLTNKYAEGYPGKRYYGGCEKVDVVEQVAIDRACKLFGASYANVQPHSGAQANQCAYAALIKPGDKILGMSLDAGGHLTHGTKMNFSGKFYESYSYGLDSDTERIDYDQVQELAEEIHPQVIVAGASAYPRVIDFELLRRIADSVGAYLMVDMAHIAGLVAAGVHPSPVPYAHIVTSTTHKSLRGPRGGFILTNDADIAKKVNSSVFPGAQGGPLMHVIAGKAVAFGEALTPEFKEYAGRVAENAKALGKGMSDGGLRLVTGGTDNHLCLVDLQPAGVTGKAAEDLLTTVHLTVNKNAIPNDPQPSTVTSGIRVGSPAATTRGLDAEEFYAVGKAIAAALFAAGNEAQLANIAQDVDAIIARHPLYEEL